MSRDCYSCNGTGTYRYTCMTCNGTGYVREIIAGQLYESSLREIGGKLCPKCKGKITLSVPCSDCSGTGDTSMKGTGPKRTCYFCKGSGKIPCCSSGCERCGWTRWEPCPACRGEGRMEWYG
jgi:DnaJ-class molecular chaperone